MRNRCGKRIRTTGSVSSSMRKCLRQTVCGFRKMGAKDILRFPDREPTDGETVEGKIGKLRRAFRPKIGKKAALDDTKKKAKRNALSVKALPLAHRSLSPPAGELHGVAGVGIVRTEGHAFIEDHHNIASEIALYAKNTFRCEEMA